MIKVISFYAIESSLIAFCDPYKVGKPLGLAEYSAWFWTYAPYICIHQWQSF